MLMVLLVLPLVLQRPYQEFFFFVLYGFAQNSEIFFLYFDEGLEIFSFPSLNGVLLFVVYREKKIFAAFGFCLYLLVSECYLANCRFSVDRVLVYGHHPFDLCHAVAKPCPLVFSHGFDFSLVLVKP